MATIDNYLPIVLKWEASTEVQQNESLESAFFRARKSGFSNDAADPGGATMVGVTFNTYKNYCKRNGLRQPSVDDLKSIPYKIWRDIVHSMYWNKWKADTIKDQRVANMLVDWTWMSGASISIKRVQKILGVTQDGIVGPKTIHAINNFPGLIDAIYEARKNHFEAIVKSRPASKKFLKGWINRINYIYNYDKKQI